MIGAMSSLALCPDIDAVVSVFGDANAPGGAGMLLEALAIASGTMASTGNRDDAFKSSNTFVLRMENVSQFNRDPVLRSCGLNARLVRNTEAST